MTDDFFLQHSDVPQRQESLDITPEQRAFIDRFDRPDQIDTDAVKPGAWPMPAPKPWAPEPPAVETPGLWQRLRELLP